jgi:WD40 repeat protein
VKRLQHTAVIYALFITPDNRQLIVLDNNKRRTFYDVDTLKKVQEHDALDCLTSASFSRDGTRVLYHSSAYRSAILSHTQSDETIAFFHHFGRLGGIHSAQLNQKGDRVLTASGDGTAVLWYTDRFVRDGRPYNAQKKIEIDLDQHFGQCSARFSKDEKKLFIIRDKGLIVYDLFWRRKKVVIEKDEQLWQSDISSDDRLFVTLYKKSAVVFAVKNGKELARIDPLEAEQIERVFFSPDGKMIVVIYPNALRLFSTDNFQPVLEQPIACDGFGLKLILPQFSADMQSIYVVQDEEKIHKVDLVSGEVVEVMVFDEPIKDMGMSIDRSIFWVRAGEDAVYLYDKQPEK